MLCHRYINRIGSIGLCFNAEKEFKVKQSKPIVICVFDKNAMKEYINLQTILEKLVLVLKSILEKQN